MPGSKIGCGSRRGEEGVPQHSQESRAEGELILLLLSSNAAHCTVSLITKLFYRITVSKTIKQGQNRLHFTGKEVGLRVMLTWHLPFKDPVLFVDACINHPWEEGQGRDSYCQLVVQTSNSQTGLSIRITGEFG